VASLLDDGRTPWIYSGECQELNIYVILGFLAVVIIGPFVIAILFLLFRVMLLIIVQVVSLLFGKKSPRTTTRKRRISRGLREFGKTYAWR
jgi:ABC-type uncharacterized transport system permease subunit